jgi:hypothetical protein
MKPEGVVFNVVTALSARAAAVAGVLASEASGCEGAESGHMFVWTPNGWAAAPSTPWPVRACLDTEQALVGVGMYGDLHYVPWAGGEVRDTQLDAGPLRVQGARRVGSRWYICTMGRQVFMSEDGVHWSGMNDGLEASADEEVTSVSNLAGDGTVLLAVGVYGTVFRRDSDRGPWQKVASGVRSWLKDVAWHDGAFWICGRYGTLLTGSGHPGEAFAHIDVGTRSLGALRTFRGRLYALADTGLLRIEPSGVVPVVTPIRPRVIDACDDTLWIAGGDTLFVSHDGEHFAPCT